MAYVRKTPTRGLYFSEESHRYYLDGKPVPGVTGVLKVLDKSDAIGKWSAETVARWVAENFDQVAGMRSMGIEAMVAALKTLPDRIKKDAGDRGKAFHEYAQEILLGGAPIVPPDKQAMVQASLDFMEDWQVEPVLVEAAVGSREHRYGGTLDLVADVQPPDRPGQIVRAIIDWKSSRRIYAEIVFQLVGYGFAEFHGLYPEPEVPMAELGITESIGVHIRDDGYSAHRLPYGPDIFQEFVKIRQVAEIHKRAKGDYKRPGSGYVSLPIDPPAREEDSDGVA